LGSQVGGVVETGVWTADKQPVALLAKKNDWIVQVIPLGGDSRFFALLGSAPQELNTARPEAKLTC
jgi:hypothetical protein